MYLRRGVKPRVIMLEDGSTMTRADLPPSNTRRWVASRKAKVVSAVEANLIDAKEACELYSLTQEELDTWRRAVLDHGVKALRITSLQDYRHINEGRVDKRILGNE